MSGRSIANRLQTSFEALYGVEAPNVDAFVVPLEEGREALLVRKARGALELSLRLPKEALDEEGALPVDVVCQIAEGVSHFLYVIERARRKVPTTQLELEIQAEVDKFALLSGFMADGVKLSSRHLRDVRQRLFHDAVYLHPRGTEQGDRYRTANDVARRFAGSLERDAERGHEHLRRTLRTFYGRSQREKLEMAKAA